MERAHVEIGPLTLLVHDDHPGAEDTEEAGADEDQAWHDQHEEVYVPGLRQVKVGGHKVVLQRGVEAGEARLRRVVPTVVPKVPDDEGGEQLEEGDEPVEDGALLREGVGAALVVHLQLRLLVDRDVVLEGNDGRLGALVQPGRWERWQGWEEVGLVGGGRSKLIF